MEEETLYSDGTNWITNQRLIFGDTQYPLGDAINAAMKAEYPQKVVLARISVIVGLVILFGLEIFLQGKGDDPLFGPIIVVANTVAIVGTLALSIYSMWVEYRKRPSFRKVMLESAVLLLLAILILLWSFGLIPNSTLTPFWLFAFGIGWPILRILGRRGTFRIQMLERIRTVDIFSSTDRQLVENLIGYIRLALVKHPKLTPAGVKSPS